MREPFDWDREWYPGAEPVRIAESWRDIVRRHPAETSLILLLAAAVLVWLGVS